MSAVQPCNCKQEHVVVFKKTGKIDILGDSIEERIARFMGKGKEKCLYFGGF